MHIYRLYYYINCGKTFYIKFTRVSANYRGTSSEILRESRRPLTTSGRSSKDKIRESLNEI